ncbi:hypothetical protein [Actinomadura pelletieri]|uniref:hypothetical protein n=1 Tax=Actinomadura pelletieri TaxID=111805 RepID=UPI0011C40C24|nr:hypothetical protein [Actinomadura pelletieri]
MPVELPYLVLLVDELRPAFDNHFGTKRHLLSGEPPTDPGVYVWSSIGRMLYIGSAKSLAVRLAKEQGLIDGHDPDNEWEVTVIHQLKRFDATVEWVPTVSHRDALTLERRLIEWHRACTGNAPPVAGWEAKRGSRRWLAERWARKLWNQRAADSTSLTETAGR